MEKTACGGGGGGGGGGDPFFLLHEDSLIEILVRLPAVTLLRFKSVCKSWCALINSSFFIHLHTAATTTFNSSSSKYDTFILRTGNYSSENANEILMLSSEYGSEYEHESEYGDGYRCTDDSWHKFTGGYWLWDNISCGWYWVSGGGYWLWDNTNCGWYWVSSGGDWHWDDTNRSWYWVGDGKDDQEVFKAAAANDDDDQQLLLKCTNLELPSCYKLTYGREIAGSCNGIICLHDLRLRDVSLWNPATREFRTLPKSITIEINDDSVEEDIVFVAFGFDVTAKDYKVLLITNFCPKSRPQRPPKFCRVQVYSLSTDSWRLFEAINSPLALPAEYYGLYLNGSCFFLANVYHPENHATNKFINSFDFTKEIFFITAQFPDHDSRLSLFLRCFGGDKMALFTTLPKTLSGEIAYNYEDPYYEDCDIWVSNEHGGCGSMNEESWTKLHSFQIVQNDGSLLPTGISNNGKFVLTTVSSYGSRMQLYNLITEESIMDFPFYVSNSKVSLYKPSLVSILGGNGAIG